MDNGNRAYMSMYAVPIRYLTCDSTTQPSLNHSHLSYFSGHCTCVPQSLATATDEVPSKLILPVLCTMRTSSLLVKTLTR